MAAVASVQASVDDPVATHQANFVGTLNVCQSMLKAGVGSGEKIGLGPFVHAEIVLQEAALHQEVLLQLQGRKVLRAQLRHKIQLGDGAADKRGIRQEGD
ncbi:NAD-dependent epimerase/dehydratase family protein, partial [Klebsiella pneumoniae]|uniref:NAD-dependent epimerase/dehydratase family protein n=1 Tax=Klebsiella pneumoniae TaxID=573 RepID=UPI00351D21A4